MNREITLSLSIYKYIEYIGGGKNKFNFAHVSFARFHMSI